MSNVFGKPRIPNDNNTAQVATLYGTREQNEIRLVMVGKTGSGKSATGNTIMTKDGHFESKMSGGSVTSECKRGECTQSGRKIVLVDTPGIFDTQIPFERISMEIIRCINMSTPGPHAFLLVIPIGRFTQEEIETLNRLFDLFGNEMGKFAIITFTKLDDLERECISIDTYINDAPQNLKDLIIRCQGRYIAINNNASEDIKIKKVNNLIKLIDSITEMNRSKFYTNAMYKEAEAALQRKIKIIENKREQEKQKEIKLIESTFVHQIDAINQEKETLAKEVFKSKASQQQFKQEKEKAQQEITEMKKKMDSMGEKRDKEIVSIKEKQKEQEKYIKLLEQKESTYGQNIQSLTDMQVDLNRKHQELELQKNSHVSDVNDECNHIKELEIQTLLDIVTGKTTTSNETMNKFAVQFEKIQQDLNKEKDDDIESLRKQLTDLKTQISKDTTNGNENKKNDKTCVIL